MLKLFFGIVLSPVVALALLSIGLLAAMLHLIAMPVLYLWERHLEDRYARVPARRAFLPSGQDPGD